MVEAKEGCACLEDVDEHTFSRFGQYLYTSDYLTADPEMLPSSSKAPLENLNSSERDADQLNLANDASHTNLTSDAVFFAGHDGEVGIEGPVPPDVVGQEEDTWGDWGALPTRKGKKRKGYSTRSKKTRLWENFEELFYPHPNPTFKPRKDCEAGKDYAAVLLSHDRLYVFADKYDIESLRSLCLHKLHQTLVRHTLHDEWVGDIVEMLRYIYSDTPDHEHSIDDLRLLSVRYAACIVEVLMKNGDFQSLLEKAGPLSKDLFGELLPRLD